MNYRLAKIGYVPNDLCTFCETGAETVHHLFYNFFFSDLFWQYFENFWFTVRYQVNVKISPLKMFLLVG